MSRECASPETEGRRYSRHSAPFARMIFRMFAASVQPMMCCLGPSNSCVELSRSSETPTSRMRGRSCQPWFYRRLLAEGHALQLSSVIRGGIGWPMRLGGSLTVQGHSTRWVVWRDIFDEEWNRQIGRTITTSPALRHRQAAGACACELSIPHIVGSAQINAVTLYGHWCWSQLWAHISDFRSYLLDSVQQINRFSISKPGFDSR
jgi:hypothetical protein